MALAPLVFTVMGVLGVVVFAISPKARTPEAKRYLAIYILSLAIGWFVIELRSNNGLNEIWTRLLGALLLIICVYGFLFGGAFLFTSVTTENNSSDDLEANKCHLKYQSGLESVDCQRYELPERASNVSDEKLKKIQFERAKGLSELAATGAKVNLPRIYDEPIKMTANMHVSICIRCSTSNPVKPAKYIYIVCKSCGFYYARRIV